MAAKFRPDVAVNLSPSHKPSPKPKGYKTLHPPTARFLTHTQKKKRRETTFIARIQSSSDKQTTSVAIPEPATLAATPPPPFTRDSN